jgi:nucleoside-diphosphate-sugar epimerase
VRRAKAGGVSFYGDRRVLVIGGLGFLGTRLTDRLRDGGAQITVMNRSLAGHGEAAAMLTAAGVRVVEGDLRDADRTREAVSGQDVIFNLAGQSGAVRSMEDPWTDLDVNCRGSLVLLEALRTDNPDARLVFVSSRLAYGSGGADPIDEEHVPDPLCVHAVHKLAAEQYLRLYRRIYGLNVTTARLTNPYGPGQPASRTAYGVVNRLIHLALSGDALPIYGDGRQRRDYIYIDDAVDALIRMAEAPESNGRLYNVGSGHGTPIVDMARSIIEMAGGGRIRFVAWPKLAEQIETGDFVADIGRIEHELGWTPRVSLADGLDRTVSHYKAHLSRLKAHPTMRVES